MLVLSRREQESILFPKLGIRVQVTRIKGKAVAIGVDAPQDVRVLRGELEEFESGDTAFEAAPVEDKTTNGEDKTTKSPLQREREHELRNRVNTLTIALHLLKKKVSRDNGLVDEELLAGAIDELALIEETLQDHSREPDLEDVERRSKLPLALLVDDNENESSLLAGYLRQSGFRVATALDGFSALQFMETNAKLPDVVLLDMNMPGLNGQGTIQAIRSNPKTSQLKVFAVSGEDARHANVMIGQQGVDRWFRKPIRPDQLVAEMCHDISTVSA